MQEIILQELNESLSVLKSFIQNDKNLIAIAKAAKTICGALENGHIIYTCGNGGSMAAAAHFSEELTGKFRGQRRPLASIAINDPSYISCVSNDFSFENIFSRFIEGVGKRGDILVVFTSSGNSRNIVKACQVARRLGLKTIGLTGKDGGKVSKILDVEIRSPQSKYSDRAQEIHLKVIHILIHLIERELFKNDTKPASH